METPTPMQVLSVHLATGAAQQSGPQMIYNAMFLYETPRRCPVRAIICNVLWQCRLSPDTQKTTRRLRTHDERIGDTDK